MTHNPFTFFLQKKTKKTKKNIMAAKKNNTNLIIMLIVGLTAAYFIFKPKKGVDTKPDATSKDGSDVTIDSGDDAESGKSRRAPVTVSKAARFDYVPSNGLNFTTRR